MTEKKPQTIVRNRTIAALSLFVVLNLGIALSLPKRETKLTEKIVSTSANEKRQEGSWIWWATRNYLKNGTAADVALMGSSQMGSALFAAEAFHIKSSVDTVMHRNSIYTESLLKDKFGRHISVFNLSFGGAMASDQYLIGQTMFTEEHKPKLVVIGVNPRDFIDNSLPSASATDAFKYLSPYVDLGNLSNCAFPDGIAWMDWQLNKLMPIRTVGDHLKAGLRELANSDESNSAQATREARLGSPAASRLSRVASAPGTSGVTPASEKAEGTGADILKAIYGTQGDVKPDQWKVVACSWGAFQDNTQEYRNRYQNPNPPMYRGQKEFFKALLAHLKEENIKVLVVGMPSLWPNRALLPDSFSKQFKAYLEETCTANGATLLNLYEDQRFDGKDYLDTVHLNSTGGRRLLQIITDAIAGNSRLASALSEKSIANASDVQ